LTNRFAAARSIEDPAFDVVTFWFRVRLPARVWTWKFPAEAEFAAAMVCGRFVAAEKPVVLNGPSVNAPLLTKLKLAGGSTESVPTALPALFRVAAEDGTPRTSKPPAVIGAA